MQLKNNVKESKTLEVSDLKVIDKQKLAEMRIGIEHDDYLTYAIKSKNISSIIYLLQTGLF